jgi:ABC-type transport system involved in cytochrome bd biosynthesis fused ATPase/permease subunit
MIASEGDEQLAHYLDIADWIALLASALLLVCLVICAAMLRRAVIRRSNKRLLVNTMFVLVLVGVTAVYYAAFVQISAFSVGVAIRRRLRQTSLQSLNAAPFIQKRARAAVEDPGEFYGVYPGWLVRWLPLAIVPATLFAYSVRRRAMVA